MDPNLHYFQLRKLFLNLKVLVLWCLLYNIVILFLTFFKSMDNYWGKENLGKYI